MWALKKEDKSDLGRHFSQHHVGVVIVVELASSAQVLVRLLPVAQKSAKGFSFYDVLQAYYVIHCFLLTGAPFLAT